MGSFGGPISPNLIFGVPPERYKKDWTRSEATLITILIRNDANKTNLEPQLAWEAQYVLGIFGGLRVKRVTKGGILVTRLLPTPATIFGGHAERR